MIATRLADAIDAISAPYTPLILIALGIGLLCGSVALLIPHTERILLSGMVALVTAVGSTVVLALLTVAPAQQEAEQAAVDNIANNLDIEDIVVQETVLGRDGYQITVEYTVIGESGRETLDMVYDPGYTAMLPMSGQDHAAILPLTEGAVLDELHDTGRASW